MYTIIFIKKITFFFTEYRNEHREHKFRRQKNKKSNFYKNKKPPQLVNIDVDIILVSEKQSHHTENVLKYFIGYNDNDVIRPLYLRLPQMTSYDKIFNENTTMSFRINNKKLLNIYNKIWEKIEKLVRIDFESKPVYGDNDKYIKTKIKIYADYMITNFHNKKMSKEKASCKCLSIIMLDFAIKANKYHYPQTFLGECKYVQEKIKIGNYIDEDLEKSEPDSDSNDESESNIDNDKYDE